MSTNLDFFKDLVDVLLVIIHAFSPLTCSVAWFLWRAPPLVWHAPYAWYYLKVIELGDLGLSVSTISWASLLLHPKPWAFSTSDRPAGVTFILEDVFRLYFLLALPVIIMSIEELPTTIKQIELFFTRKMHAAVDFEISFPDTLIACYLPVPPGSPCDRQLERHGRKGLDALCRDDKSICGIGNAAYNAIFRGPATQRTRGCQGKRFIPLISHKFKTTEHNVAVSRLSKKRAMMKYLDHDTATDDSDVNSPVTRIWSDKGAGVISPNRPSAPIVQEPSEIPVIESAEETTIDPGYLANKPTDSASPQSQDLDIPPPAVDEERDEEEAESQAKGRSGPDTNTSEPLSPSNVVVEIKQAPQEPQSQETTAEVSIGIESQPREDLQDDHTDTTPKSDKVKKSVKFEEHKIATSDDDIESPANDSSPKQQMSLGNTGSVYMENGGPSGIHSTQLPTPNQDPAEHLDSPMTDAPPLADSERKHLEEVVNQSTPTEESIDELLESLLEPIFESWAPVSVTVPEKEMVDAPEILKSSTEEQPSPENTSLDTSCNGGQSTVSEFHEFFDQCNTFEDFLNDGIEPFSNEGSQMSGQRAASNADETKPTASPDGVDMDIEIDTTLCSSIASFCISSEQDREMDFGQSDPIEGVGVIDTGMGDCNSIWGKDEMATGADMSTTPYQEIDMSSQDDGPTDVTMAEPVVRHADWSGGHEAVVWMDSLVGDESSDSNIAAALVEAQLGPASLPQMAAAVPAFAQTGISAAQEQAENGENEERKRALGDVAASQPAVAKLASAAVNPTAEDAAAACSLILGAESKPFPSVPSIVPEVTLVPMTNSTMAADPPDPPMKTPSITPGGDAVKSEETQTTKDPSPMRLGGMMFPGGNPTLIGPVTLPSAQPDITPESQRYKTGKDKSSEKMQRPVRKKKPVDIFNRSSRRVPPPSSLARNTAGPSRLPNSTSSPESPGSQTRLSQVIPLEFAQQGPSRLQVVSVAEMQELERRRLEQIEREGEANEDGGE